MKNVMYYDREQFTLYMDYDTIVNLPYLIAFPPMTSF